MTRGLCDSSLATHHQQQVEKTHDFKRLKVMRFYSPMCWVILRGILQWRQVQVKSQDELRQKLNRSYTTKCEGRPEPKWQVKFQNVTSHSYPCLTSWWRLCVCGACSYNYMDILLLESGSDNYTCTSMYPCTAIYLHTFLLGKNLLFQQIHPQDVWWQFDHKRIPKYKNTKLDRRWEWGLMSNNI